ncbi:hypothetical protein WICPIJ_004854, partial [Wickerhamomyces pijperi]
SNVQESQQTQGPGPDHDDDGDDVLSSEQMLFMPSESTPLVSSTDSASVYSSTAKLVISKHDQTLLEEEEELLEQNHLIPSTSTDNNSRSKHHRSASVNSVPEIWESAIDKNKIHTSYYIEHKNLIESSLPLMLTFILQNSLTLTAIFIVGHIGTLELAGITLGTMTANITGLAALQGLATCLDTLCSQAYGADKFQLVGLQVVRCFTFAVSCFIPIAVLWWVFSYDILTMFIEDKALIAIAVRYLKVVSFGMPGFILFEVSKRYLQCQGIFHASSIVLMICAPLNLVISYFLVYVCAFGYIGTAYAIALNYWMMPLGILIFVLRHPETWKCWPSNLKLKQVFQNWNRLIELALPGIIMVEVEFLAFEITTIMASSLGTTALAAQSVLSSICSLAYQLPFSISIATSTRVANLIGASLKDSSLVSCKSSMFLGLIIGLINAFTLVAFSEQITSIFTNDSEIINLALKVVPVIGYMEIIDSLNACSAGCLRGQGLQAYGGYINIFAFYIVGLPFAYYLTFVINMGLTGLWLGITVGLTSIAVLQSLLVFWYCDWDNIIEQAKDRNNEV